MIRQILYVFLAVTVLEVAAFRYLHRDLFWIARPEASTSPVEQTRETVRAALARPTLSRHHAEALLRATDREGLRAEHLATLERLTLAYPDEIDLHLRYAEALRLDGRLEQAARVFARVAEAR